MRHPSPSLIPGLLLALAACDPGVPVGARAAAVVNGSLDGDDPAVVMVAIAGGGLCSGTVISPHVVVTAAHCSPPDEVAFGPSVDEIAQRIDVVDYALHARYDIGVATLAEAAPVAPIPFNRDYLVPYVGMPVRIVGYGVTDELASDSGVKRQGMARLAYLNQEEMWTDYAESSPCFGDSGGPLFMTFDGEERVAGVVSHGIRFDCGTADGAGVRTDSAAAWIDDWVVANEPSDPPAIAITAPRDGDSVEPAFPVSVDASDDHGVRRVELWVDDEVNDADDEAPWSLAGLPTLALGAHRLEVRAFDAAGQEARDALSVTVAPACAVDPDCPQDDVCLSGICRHALGESCEMHGECASGLCGVVDGFGACTQRCDPGSCPSDFHCEEPTFPGGSGQCVRGAPLDGCALGRLRRRPGGGVLLLALAALAAAVRPSWRPARRGSRRRS